MTDSRYIPCTVNCFDGRTFKGKTVSDSISQDRYTIDGYDQRTSQSVKYQNLLEMQTIKLYVHPLTGWQDTVLALCSHYSALGLTLINIPLGVARKVHQH